MAESTPKAASNIPSLSPREMEIMFAAFRCLKSGPAEVDYVKLAEEVGLGNSKSATTAWCTIKKKIFPNQASASKGQKSGTPAKTKASTKTAKEDNAASSTKATGKKARKVAGIAEDDQSHVATEHNDADEDSEDAIDDQDVVMKDASLATQIGKVKTQNGAVESEDELARDESPTIGELPATPASTVPENTTTAAKGKAKATKKPAPIVTNNTLASPEASVAASEVDPATPNTPATPATPASKKRGRKTKAEKQAEAAANGEAGEGEEGTEATAPPAKKVRKTPVKKAKNVDEGVETIDGEVVPLKPKSASRKNTKKAAKDAENATANGEDGDAEAEADTPKKSKTTKPKTPRKPAATKAAKAEKIEKGSEDVPATNGEAKDDETTTVTAKNGDGKEKEATEVVEANNESIEKTTDNSATNGEVNGDMKMSNTTNDAAPTEPAHTSKYNTIPPPKPATSIPASAMTTKNVPGTVIGEEKDGDTVLVASAQDTNGAGIEVGDVVTIVGNENGVDVDASASA